MLFIYRFHVFFGVSNISMMKVLSPKSCSFWFLSIAFGIRSSDMRSDLFEMADVLSKQPLPSGNRLAILTNAGGPGVLATDALASHGGVVAELSHKTVEALNLVLPSCLESWKSH